MSSAILTATTLALTSSFLAKCGGPRGMITSYWDTMWDWPRKAGGGPSRTQALEDWGTRKFSKAAIKPFLGY